MYNTQAWSKLNETKKLEQCFVLAFHTALAVSTFTCILSTITCACIFLLPAVLYFLIVTIAL